MRVLSLIEKKIVCGAFDYPRIQQYPRNWGDNDLDDIYELEAYVIKNYPNDLPFFRGLSYGLRVDMGELYFRTVSYEDTLWQAITWGPLAATGLGIAGLIGYALGRHC